MRSTAREIVAGSCDHVRQQLPEDLVVELVDLVVALADLPGQLVVAVDERVEGVPDHLLGHQRPCAGCR